MGSTNSRRALARMLTPRVPPSSRSASASRRMALGETAVEYGGAMNQVSSRPRCSAFIATSLDGYIARADGAIDWLSRVELAGEDYGYAAFAASVDGRNTYEVIAGFERWPFADKRVVVLSSQPHTSLHGEEFDSGDVQTVLGRLSEEGATRLYVDGGRVIQQFLAADLLDDLTLSVLPVVLGSGIPLFGQGAPERWLSLESARSFQTGLVQLRYQRKRLTG
jgi:dihydrofolate reductase